MKHLLLFTAAVLFLSLTAQPSFAAACPRGGYTTPACRRALNQLTGQGDSLLGCLSSLQAEYNGGTGHGVGKGPAYEAKKRQCRELAASVLNKINQSGAELDEAGVDNSPEAAVQAVKNWK